MSGPVSPVRFGDCQVDLEARELRRRGAPVPLSPRAFELLSLLVRQRPRALSRHELQDALWPDTFVGYTSLAQLVAEVRKALGESTARPRWIRTVPRFGYAFAADGGDERAAALDVVGTLVGADREYVVSSGVTLVGRGTECAVRLDSSKVSRVHARIRADASHTWLEDASSKNGTWLNGQRCEGRVALQHGDEIVVGGCRLIFQRYDRDGATQTLETRLRPGGHRTHG